MKMELRPAQGYAFVGKENTAGREIVGAVVGCEDDGRVVFATVLVRDATQMVNRLGNLDEHVSGFIDNTKPASQA